MRLKGISKIFKGFKLYNWLKQEESKKVKIICPLGIGDTINVVRLVTGYCHINRIKGITLVLKEAHQDIPTWYQLECPKIVLSADEMRGLYLFMSIFHKYNSKYIFFAFFHRTLLGKIIQPGKIVDDYCRLVMNVDKSAASRPQIQYLKEDRYKDAVLLAPYSYTLERVPLKFYQKIVEFFREKDFLIYCNLQKNEEPIVNTIPLYLTLNELMKVSFNFKIIVGSRSGLCDALSLCKCKLIVLYPMINEQENSIEIDGDVINDNVSDLNGDAHIENFQYCADKEDELLQGIFRTCNE